MFFSNNNNVMNVLSLRPPPSPPHDRLARLLHIVPCTCIASTPAMRVGVVEGEGKGKGRGEGKGEGRGEGVRRREKREGEKREGEKREGEGREGEGREGAEGLLLDALERLLCMVATSCAYAKLADSLVRLASATSLSAQREEARRAFVNACVILALLRPPSPSLGILSPGRVQRFVCMIVDDVVVPSSTLRGDPTLIPLMKAAIPTHKQTGTTRRFMKDLTARDNISHTEKKEMKEMKEEEGGEEGGGRSWEEELGG